MSHESVPPSRSAAERGADSAARRPYLAQQAKKKPEGEHCLVPAAPGWRVGGKNHKFPKRFSARLSGAQCPGRVVPLVWKGSVIFESRGLEAWLGRPAPPAPLLFRANDGLARRPW